MGVLRGRHGEGTAVRPAMAAQRVLLPLRLNGWGRAGLAVGPEGRGRRTDPRGSRMGIGQGAADPTLRCRCTQTATGEAPDPLVPRENEHAAERPAPVRDAPAVGDRSRGEQTGARHGHRSDGTQGHGLIPTRASVRHRRTARVRRRSGARPSSGRSDAADSGPTGKGRPGRLVSIMRVAAEERRCGRWPSQTVRPCEPGSARTTSTQSVPFGSAVERTTPVSLIPRPRRDLDDRRLGTAVRPATRRATTAWPPTPTGSGSRWTAAPSR